MRGGGPLDSSVTPPQDGGCYVATDCPSGSHCDCGFLNVNFASPGCGFVGRCVTALASCNPASPDTVLCDVDGGCPLGGTCGNLGLCSSPCPLPEAGPEAGVDASSEGGADAAMEGGADAATDAGVEAGGDGGGEDGGGD